MVQPVSSATFRDILSRFASGVTIVAARTKLGPVGFTATGFTSVSLSPPLILACVNKTASVYQGIIQADSFGVSILDSSQASLARRFAQSDVDRFEGVVLRAPVALPVPLIEGALAHLECRRHSVQDVGDHSLVVGEVIGGYTGSGQPLVHFHRHFGTFVVETVDPAERCG